MQTQHVVLQPDLSSFGPDPLIATCPMLWCIKDATGELLSSSPTYPPALDAICRTWRFPLAHGHVITWFMQDA